MLLKKFLLAISVVCLSLSPCKVFATPTLGVAVDGGIYAYTDSSALTDSFVTHFASSIVEAIGEYEGFVIEPSPFDLTVFTSYNPSSVNIYLMACMDSSYAPTFGGQPLMDMRDTGQANGYKPLPYYGILLPDTGWTDHVFESSKTFYLCTAEATYTGDLSNLPLGYYFFAAADINGTVGLQYAGKKGSHDDFSPKTTSAGGHTPEPATLSLLGLGLLGFGVVRRRKSIRNLI